MADEIIAVVRNVVVTALESPQGKCDSLSTEGLTRNCGKR